MKKTKPKSSVWGYFQSNAVNGKILYECVFCKAGYTKNATRLVKHIAKCRKAPDHIKEMFPYALQAKNNSISEPSTSAIDQSTDMATLPILSQTKPKIVSVKGSQSVETEADTENNSLDELFARAVFSSESPLSLIENKHWINFIHKLKPNYRIPSRHKFTYKLLEDEYHRINSIIKNKITEAAYLGLHCDVWRNDNNENVISFVLSTPQPVFYKTITTAADHCTAEFMAFKIDEIIAEIGVENVGAIITESLETTIDAISILQQKYDHLAAYNCASSTLSSILNDIIRLKSIELIQTDCKTIAREITNSEALQAHFAELQDEKRHDSILKLSVKTKWGSILNCLDNLLKSKNVLQWLAVQDMETTLSTQSRQNVLDEETFWVPVQNLYALISPVVKWIGILEFDQPKLSEIIECFRELSDHFEKTLPLIFNKTEAHELLSLFNVKKNLALQDIHYAANILDPKFNGGSLTRDEQIQGTEFIIKIITRLFGDDNSTEVISELAEYRAKNGFYGKSYVIQTAETVDAVTWWKGTCFGSKLGKVASRILTMPPTTTTLHRCNPDLIQSAKGKRLFDEQTRKLSFITQNLRFLSLSDYDPIMLNSQSSLKVMNHTNWTSTTEKDESEFITKEVEEFEICKIN
ncbi:hypothetical protein CHUAL_013995 [Chamberlinius hualienensis]